MERNKIIISSPRFPPQPGGSQIVVYQIASILSSSKYDISVRTSWWQGCREFDSQLPFPVTRSKIWNWNNKLSRSKIRMFARLGVLFHFIMGIWRVWGGRGDLVLAGAILPCGFGALIRKIFRKTPYVVIVYGEELRWFIRNRLLFKVTKLILKNAEKIFTISKFTEKSLIDNFTVKGKIFIFQPVVRDILLEQISQEIARGKMSIKGDPVLLNVGRLESRKGTIILIRSFKTIVNRVPHAVLYIIGKGPDLPECKRLVSLLGIEDNVYFMGFVSEEQLKLYYAACDLFILPNQILPHDVEGFGIVFIEAASQGKPTIGGKSGGVEESVIDGETGILLDSITPDSIAQTVINMLDHPEKMKEMGKRGSERVLKQFTLENRRSEVIKIISKLI